MMTSAAEQYRKELKKHLSLDVCSGKLRTALGSVKSYAQICFGIW